MLDDWGREAILVYFLTASWRKPIDFSDESMAQAAARRDTLRNAFTLEAAPLEDERWDAFVSALEDDFDTPAALAVMYEWAAARQLELLRARARGVRPCVARGPRGSTGRGRRARRAPSSRTGRARLRDVRPAPDELGALGWQMRDEPGGGFTLVRS